MVSTLKIEDNTKERFDKAQAKISATQDKNATQDDALNFLLDLFERQEASA